MSAAFGTLAAARDMKNAGSEVRGGRRNSFQTSVRPRMTWTPYAP